MAEELMCNRNACAPSRLLIVIVACFTKLISKIIIGKALIINSEKFLNQLKKYNDRPIITVSNHLSYMDDPLMWALLPWSFILKTKRHRWVLGAKEICFANKLSSWFFSKGQVIPVQRGMGIHQRGVDLALKQLSKNGWVHIFPEGKINSSDGNINPFKWGVGRLALESKMPIIIPIWHSGLNEILPTGYLPCLPKLKKTVVVSYGDAIDLNDEELVDVVKDMDEDMKRSYITEYIRVSLMRLKQGTVNKLK